jgi:putative ABC transport system permease protein
MAVLWQDLRLGARALARAPGFTAVAILTLALGLGGSAAIFSFIRGVLLRPLPYPEPRALVLVCESNLDRPDPAWCGGSPANLWDWQRQSRTLQAIGLGRSWEFGIKSPAGRFEPVAGGVATAGLFEVLRIRPHQGRLLERRDHDAGSDHVAVLSHELWQSRFGGDETILGRAVNLDEEIYTVIGVLPSGARVPGLEEAELWIPLWAERADWRHWRGFRPYARLAAGSSLAAAAAEMQGIARRLAEQYPETNKAWGIEVRGLHADMVASVRPALWVFLGAVGIVLLIACANTASLLLARAAGRQREFSIRAALGAGRRRLVRFQLAESLLLALASCAVGVLLALGLVSLLVGLAPAGFPRLEQVRVDGWTVGFAALLSLVTCALFGIFPAWRASRLDLQSVLKEGHHGGSARGPTRARSALVVLEVALALVLLTSTGLLMRSFVNLTRWQPGFDTGNVLSFSLFPSQGKYRSRAQLVQLYERVQEEISALPGVIAVGEVSAGPLFGGGDGEAEFTIAGQPVPAEGSLPTVAWFDCGPNYFRALGVPLRRGRFFSRADTMETTRVAIVNESMANRYFPGRDPIGQRVHLRLVDATFEIVGVVADTQPFDPRQVLRPQIYWPLYQAPRWATFVAVRVAGNPAGLIPALRSRLATVDPDLSMSGVATLEERIAAQLERPRFHLTLPALFAVVALLIAVVGLYGIISYSVAARRREFGIRLALGARRFDIVRSVVGQGLVLAVLGVAAGVAAALAATRLLRSLLVMVTPTDPLVLAAVPLLLLAVAAVASYVPARRAARVDPVVALRCE